MNSQSANILCVDDERLNIQLYRAMKLKVPTGWQVKIFPLKAGSSHWRISMTPGGCTRKSDNTIRDCINNFCTISKE